MKQNVSVLEIFIKEIIIHHYYQVKCKFFFLFIYTRQSLRLPRNGAPSPPITNKQNRPRIPSREHPPPKLQQWLDTFKVWCLFFIVSAQPRPFTLCSSLLGSLRPLKRSSQKLKYYKSWFLTLKEKKLSKLPNIMVVHILLQTSRYMVDRESHLTAKV